MFYFVSQPAMSSSYGYPHMETTSPEEQYYRRLAEQHRHQAAIALARARYQEQQAAQRAELTHNYHLGHNPFALNQHYIYPSDNSPFDTPFFPDAFPVRRGYAALPQYQRQSSLEQILRRQAESRIEAALQARRQRELDEAKRLQFIAQRRHQERIRQEQSLREQSIEDVLLSIFGARPSDLETPVPAKEPTAPVNHCQAGGCRPNSTSRVNPFEALLAELFDLGEESHTEPAHDDCTCQTCKRASAPPSPKLSNTAPVVAPHPSGPSSSAGKGKAPEVPRNAFHAGFERVNGHVLPLGLTPEERQQILTALGITAVESSNTSSSNQTATTVKPADRTSSLSSISTLETKFNTLKSTFDFPTKVDFSESASGSAPLLAFSPNNTAVHSYESNLNSLLTQIDEVESNGEEQVREKRKSLVIAVESELESLDKKKVDAWITKEKEQRVVGSQENVEEDVVPGQDPSNTEVEVTVQTSEESTTTSRNIPTDTIQQRQDNSLVAADSVIDTSPATHDTDLTTSSRQRASSAPAELPVSPRSIPVLPRDSSSDVENLSVSSDSESDADEFASLINGGEQPVVQHEPGKDEVVGYELI